MSDGRANRMIGVFTADLDDAYQMAVWRGIESRAQQMNLGIICFVGSRLASPIVAESTANFAYHLADPQILDGLIVVSASMTTFLAERGVRELFAGTSGLPRVSVGVDVPGVTSVTVDGSGGIRDVVAHLARVHGRTRFAVIGGPPDHAEAEQRLRAYLDALGNLGLEADPRLYVSGTFVQESGASAARELIGRGTPFDALVCMNDRMAIGALGELRRAGIQVPEEVSVVGFDGIEEGRCVTPPLSTVIQPLNELGVVAVDALCELMNGGEPKQVLLSSIPSISESCGCPPRLSFADEDDDQQSSDDEATKSVQRELIELALNLDLRGFLKRLNLELSSASLNGNNLRRWYNELSQIRREASAAATEGGDTRTELFELARTLVAETEARLQAERRVAAENRFATLRSISAALGAAFELPVLLERLHESLTKLGIRRGYLALFEQQTPGLHNARLIFSHSSERQDGRRLPIRFKAGRLLPPSIDEAWRGEHWVLEPLVFQDEAVGYLLLSGGVEEPAVYDSLRDQVASSLKGSLLFRQVREHERSLEAEVARRTQELTRTNLELKQEISRRARLEQEVIDISNRTMERIGQDLHDDLCQHLAGIAMLTSVARERLPKDEGAATDSIDRISVLLSDSIDRVKQIARGLVPAGLEQHGLSAAIETLVSTARRSYPATIDFRAAPDFTIEDTDRALQVYRIVQEALSNALKHSHADHISVRLYREHNHEKRPGSRTLVAEVTDSGAGISDRPSGDGMGMRIMRYRAEKAHITLGIVSRESGTRVVCRIPDPMRGAL